MRKKRKTICITMLTTVLIIGLAVGGHFIYKYRQDIAGFFNKPAVEETQENNK